MIGVAARHWISALFSVLFKGCFLGGWLTGAVALAADVGLSVSVHDCVVTPHRTVELSRAVPGILASVAVDRSSFVRKDQEIAQLEAAVERADVRVARAQMVADMRISEASLAFNKANRCVFRPSRSPNPGQADQFVE